MRFPRKLWIPHGHIISGFPTGVENLEGSSKFDGGLSQYIDGIAWGLKTVFLNLGKIIWMYLSGVHLILKLQAVGLQASNFTKN